MGDYQEMKSLQTLCDGRVKPLLAGCVKSNLGHTEATSGLCSIAKSIIAMETGFIPPNLHFTSPQNGIEALQTGKIQVKPSFNFARIIRYAPFHIFPYF